MRFLLISITPTIYTTLTLEGRAISRQRIFRTPEVALTQYIIIQEQRSDKTLPGADISTTWHDRPFVALNFSWSSWHSTRRRDIYSSSGETSYQKFSCEVSKPRDMFLEFTNRVDILRVFWDHCCWAACQKLNRYEWLIFNAVGSKVRKTKEPGFM